MADAFFEAIGGSGLERVMELQWREADLLRIERAPPKPTRSGKIQHLHQELQRETAEVTGVVG